MDPAVNVNDAITNYRDWSHPWLFHQAVASALGHQGSSKALFADVWREAMDDRHWQSADLGSCVKSAASAIREKFPTISEPAAKAIANAASYEWK
jgi:hypothetical protein